MLPRLWGALGQPGAGWDTPGSWQVWADAGRAAVVALIEAPWQARGGQAALAAGVFGGEQSLPAKHSHCRAQELLGWVWGCGEPELTLCCLQVLEAGVLDTITPEERKRQEVREAHGGMGVSCWDGWCWGLIPGAPGAPDSHQKGKHLRGAAWFRGCPKACRCWCKPSDARDGIRECLEKVSRHY